MIKLQSRTLKCARPEHFGRVTGPEAPVVAVTGSGVEPVSTVTQKPCPARRVSCRQARHRHDGAPGTSAVLRVIRDRGQSPSETVETASRSRWCYCHFCHGASQ